MNEGEWAERYEDARVFSVCKTCGCPDPGHLYHGRPTSAGPCPDSFHDDYRPETGGFVDVADDFTIVGRPARGYVTMVTYDGHAAVVNRELLIDQPETALLMLDSYEPKVRWRSPRELFDPSPWEDPRA